MCVCANVCVCAYTHAYVRVHIHVCKYWMQTQWAYKDKEFFWRQCVLVVTYLIFLRRSAEGWRHFHSQSWKGTKLKKCNAFFKSSYVQVATKHGPHINNCFSQNDHFLVHSAPSEACSKTFCMAKQTNFIYLHHCLCIFLVFLNTDFFPKWIHYHSERIRETRLANEFNAFLISSYMQNI